MSLDNLLKFCSGFVRVAEAPGDPAAGAVAVGGERRPPRGQTSDSNSKTCLLLDPNKKRPVWLRDGFADDMFFCIREQEMKLLQRACTALSKENGKLEVSDTPPGAFELYPFLFRAHVASRPPYASTLGPDYC